MTSLGRSHLRSVSGLAEILNWAWTQSSTSGIEYPELVSLSATEVNQLGSVSKKNFVQSADKVIANQVQDMLELRKGDALTRSLLQASTSLELSPS